MYYVNTLSILPVLKNLKNIFKLKKQYQLIKVNAFFIIIITNIFTAGKKKHSHIMSIAKRIKKSNIFLNKNPDVIVTLSDKNQEK